jgi:ribosomal protein L11 methyltransferase
MVAKSSIASNPFHQPPRQWQIQIPAHLDTINILEEAFEDVALANLSFETDEAAKQWVVDIITDIPPEAIAIENRLALIAGMHKITTPSFTVRPLEIKDWQSEVEKSFTPLHVGNFYIYGSHIKEPPPISKIAIQVNAGLAFGSGEHATTSGCLVALAQLAKRRHFVRPLDMGCGSGILAIAAAKLWHVPVIGVDIDPVSIAVSESNAMRNRVTALTRFEVSNGYQSNIINSNAPYDLIVANVLARPLVKMAPALAAHLAPGGVAVLSGLLGFQERQVLSAHLSQGLRLLSRIKRGEWHTLVLGK